MVALGLGLEIAFGLALELGLVLAFEVGLGLGLGLDLFVGCALAEVKQLGAREQLLLHFSAKGIAVGGRVGVNV